MSKLRLRIFFCLIPFLYFVATTTFSVARQDKAGRGDEPPIDLKSLHKGEMEALAKRYEKDGRAERAIDLRKRWLDTKRRETLDPRDAEGRIALGDLYESLINDKKTAANLYMEALAIDPNQQRGIDGLVRLGYRKRGKDWFPAETASASPIGVQPVEPARSPVDPANGLKGLSRDEVISRLGGKPDRVVRVATQGRVVEQWIYRGARESQYINFQGGGSIFRPIVLDHFTLPESVNAGVSR